MTKKYLVVERGFEYNDEGYDVTEFGDPKTIFDDKTKAEAHLKELSKKWFQDHDLYDYFGGNLDWCFGCKEPELAKELNIPCDEDKYGDYNLEFPQKWSDEQLEWLLKHLHKGFFPYYIQEVPYVE